MAADEVRSTHFSVAADNRWAAEQQTTMKNKEAIEQWQRQIQLKPDDVEAYKGLGNALQVLGKLNEAKRAYEIAVAIQPDFAAAHGNIGNIYYLQGEFDRAVECYERAIAASLSSPMAAPGRKHCAPTPHTPSLLPGIYANLGQVRRDQGLLEEAVACWQKALSLDRNFGSGQLHWKLGNVLLNLGRYDEAIACYEKLIFLWEKDRTLVSKCRGDSLFAPTSHNLPKSRQSQKQPDRLAKLYSNLGSARLYDGQVEAAIAAFNQALEIEPYLVELQCNLGLATGRLAAESKDPLLASDRFNQAASYFLRALAVKPNMLEAHRGLFELIRTFQANNGDLSPVRQAADRYYGLCSQNPEAEPGKIVALTARAIGYLKSGNADIAQKSLPEIEQGLSQQHFSQWNQELIDLLYSTVLFCLNRLQDDLVNNARISRLIGSQFSQYLVNKYQGNHEAEPLDMGSQAEPRNQGMRSQFSQYLVNKYQGNHEAERRDTALPCPVNSISQANPLKIGFISGHFRRHSVGWCSADIIAALSEMTPHIYLYQTQEGKLDDKTEEFKQIAAKFYQPCQFNSEKTVIEIIQEIKQDQLDILIDLDSLTISRHAHILHGQPAPLCISWLGFDAPFISDKNYFLTDWHSHPSGVDQYYREQLLRMPDSFVAVGGFGSEPVDIALKRQAMGIDLNPPPVPIGSPPAPLKKGGVRGINYPEVVYLCVAPATKLNPELALAQIKILKQVSNSILLYKGIGDTQVIKSVYQAVCEAEGVSFHRVNFLPRNRTEEEHRTIYQIADVLLDSYPYNGGTHNLEALWFELPVVTRFGGQFLARMGYSFLKTLGISEGLASNWEEYVAWGIKFGEDANLRNTIREQLKLAKNPEQLSPLWNPQKFAQDMYKVLNKTLAK